VRRADTETVLQRLKPHGSCSINVVAEGTTYKERLSGRDTDFLF
jgi:hypothetical protein